MEKTDNNSGEVIKNTDNNSGEVIKNTNNQMQKIDAYSVDYDTGMTYNPQEFNVKYDKEKKTFVTVAE
jgi:hypothetical protein